MAIKQHVMSQGTSAGAAGAIVGGVTAQAVSGSSQTDATLMPLGTHFYVTTSSSNQGCILPPGTGSTDAMAVGDWGTIFNNTTNTIKIYPPTSGIFNGGSANAAVSLTTLQKALFWKCDSTNYAILVV